MRILLFSVLAVAMIGVMIPSVFATPALDAGEYPYFYMVHPWMIGLVIVEEGHSEEAPAMETSAQTLTAADSTNNYEDNDLGFKMPNSLAEAAVQLEKYRKKVAEATEAQERLDKIMSTPEPTTIDPIDPTGIIVVIVLSVIIGIVVIALKRIKSTPNNLSSPGNTESSTMSSYECPKCKSQNILHDMRNSQYRCSDCNWSGYISKKYSDAWYLLPILIGIIGGLIFYLIIKDDDQKKATKGLLVGIISSAFSIILYVLLIIATGFLLY